MSLPSEVESSLKDFGIKVRSSSPAGGGCINECAVLRTATNSFFVKWNSVARFPGMLMTESSGLKLLKQTETLRVPDIIHQGVTETYQYLLLEYIESGERRKNYWQDFGEGLAKMHQNSSAHFGLDHDNFIGSLPQRNVLVKSWIDFFVRYRVEEQLRMASQRNLLSISPARLSKFVARLPELLVEEKPALIHGDLWGGNLMTGNGGEPVLIDPAVYYGNRECDIAMTQLFGGFDKRFIDFYNEIKPLKPGWQERLPLYNTYPILVHINLFGRSYEPQLNSIIAKYC